MTAQVEATLPTTFGKEGFGTTHAAVDTIDEFSPGVGVTADGVLLKDGGATLTGALVGTTGTFSGAVAATGGVSPAGGFTLAPRGVHSGGITATQVSDGNDTTPSVTETYICEVIIPANMTITGIAFFNGSAVGTDKLVGILFNSAGVVVANTALAGTTATGTDAFQLIPLTATYAAKGPATYYIGLQVNGTTYRFNSHILGVFGASKKTGETFGTPTTITAPTTFTTALGPIASLY
jgi:hypothetical protein